MAATRRIGRTSPPKTAGPEGKKGLSGLFFTLGVVGVSVLLLGVLGLLAYLGDPPEVPLSRLSEHEGEEVICSGVVLRVERGERSTYLLLFQGGEVAYAVIEECTGAASMNDEVRLKGSVYKSGSGFSLQVLTKNDLEVKGRYDAPRVQPADIAEHLDEYVASDCVIAALRPNDWGGGTASVLGLPDSESGGNWSRLAEVRFSELPSGLNATDRIELFGIARQSGDGVFLYVYQAEAAGISHDYWRPKEMGLGVLSEAALTSRLELSQFPVNVTGFLRYEPSFNGSLVLTEHPVLGDYQLRADVSGLASLPQLHKGDAVRIEGRLVYDEGTMRYQLVCDGLSLLASYGPWNISLGELGSRYYLYENALISTNGTVLPGADGFVLSGGGFELPLGADADLAGYVCSDVRILCRLRFDTVSLGHYLEIIKITG